MQRKGFTTPLLVCGEVGIPHHKTRTKKRNKKGGVRGKGTKDEKKKGIGKRFLLLPFRFFVLFSTVVLASSSPFRFRRFLTTGVSLASQRSKKGIRTQRKKKKKKTTSSSVKLVPPPPSREESRGRGDEINWPHYSVSPSLVLQGFPIACLFE